MTEEPIRTEEMSDSFAESVVQELEGTPLTRCLQCGTCGAGCPVHEVLPDYSPRLIVRLVQAGLENRLMESGLIWLCSTCYNCQERCPQGIRVADVITVLKNRACREGKSLGVFRLQAELIGRHGRLYEIEDFDNKKRGKQGLPPVVTDVTQIHTLFRLRGLEDLTKPEEK